MDELAAARIGGTFNQYAGTRRLRRERLRAYLESRLGAPVLLVGEAPGYRGARVSGIPFTSERQLTGRGPAEATATIVHRVLAELGLVERRPPLERRAHAPGDGDDEPTADARGGRGGLPIVRSLARGRRVVAVGRVAHDALGADYVRHPSHGGAQEFRAGLVELLDHGHLAPRSA